ncbi:ras-related protein Rab-36 [Uranotaenia lowii]|uniref:ras-related protein Rab-36 n=1 Tax=Uranotaenia lowii TaxID=190385 RepID=UPI0024789B81|nr:ras-related protein Rab-36 [Uranotaenia lowii]
MPIYKKSSKKASSYELLNNNVDYGTRKIDSLPGAFQPQATPYLDRNDFSDRTKRVCKSVTSFYLCACKAIFVGDVGVGKSSLINRFCHEIFDRGYRGTVGVDFEVEKFQVLDHPFSLQIWDTAGHEKFSCIGSQNYYRNSNVVVVVFDMTRMESLMNTRRWMADVLRVNQPGTLAFLVGTKKDLLDESSLEECESEAIKMTNDLKAELWTVSAHTGAQVTPFFRRITALAFDTAVTRLMEPNNPVIHPSGNSLLNLYFLKKDEKKRRLRNCSFCKIN